MNLLNAFLHEPAVARNWEVEQWNRFLPLARNARLLGRCLYLFEQHGLLDDVPQRLLDQLRGALAQTRFVQVQAKRELRQVWRVFERAGIPLMALKGVAYLQADLPPARWRYLADIDIMVRETEIEQAEDALRQVGWIPSGDFDDYDQHYYRDWMHEVPPLVHRDRATEVDLHHNLAPPVSRIRIDASTLWDASEECSDPYGLTVQVLAPTDMLLHNAVHLYMNDELRGGLRDVMDFRDLFEHFLAQDPLFDKRLVERAIELGCGRPLYYAVTTAQQQVGLAPPTGLLAQMQSFAPAYPIAPLMSWLIEQALSPQRLGLRRRTIANWLLFVRSHLVRMPFTMLVRHLWHKAMKPRGAATSIQETPG